MEPSLLQVYTCQESVGIFGYWLGSVRPGTCLSLMLSLAQLALILGTVIWIKHVVMGKLFGKRQDPQHTPAPDSRGSRPQPPGWINGKPAIYTKFPGS